MKGATTFPMEMQMEKLGLTCFQASTCSAEKGHSIELNLKHSSGCTQERGK